MVLGEFNETSRKHCAALDRWSHSPHGQMQMRKRWRNWKVPVGSSLRLAPQETLEWKPWTWVLHKVHCCTWHLQIDWEVSETVMSGETSDISQFCEFECFKLVIFHDETAPYLDNHINWVDTCAWALILVLPWWQRLVKTIAMSFIGPCTKH